MKDGQYNIVAVIAETDKGKVYQTVGRAFISGDRSYLLLNKSFNPAGIMGSSTYRDSSSCYLALYPSDERPAAPRPKLTDEDRRRFAESSPADDDDDIPF